LKKGICFNFAQDWSEGDPGETARKSVLICKQIGPVSLQYDCIGVGSGVKAETNRLKSSGLMGSVIMVRWNAAAPPLFKNARFITGDSESPTNGDLFVSLKSQGAWQLRLKFERTYNAITHGKIYAYDDLISIDPEMENLHKFVDELSQPTYTTNNAGKIVINKMPGGALSPNLYDAAVMSAWPVQSVRVLI
jgi:hypothetical protein